MKLKISTILMFLLIVAIAFSLRVWRYAYFPIGGETADENAWTLLGASLIQEKVPASWSFFAAYEDYHYVEGVFDAPIVRPALDHPPLFSFLPGTAHSIKSFWLDSPSFKVIRFPLVILGALNAGLFWLLVRKIFARTGWAVLAATLFITIPEIVFGSRLVVAENLLVSWVLLAMLTVMGKTNQWTIGKLVGLSVLAVLTKVTGLIIPTSLIIYGLLTKEHKLTRAGIIGGALGIGLFALYGAFYNWQLFVAVFFSQSARELGLATLQNRLFLNPTIVKHLIFDGWKITGLLAATVLLSKGLIKTPKLLLTSIFTVVSLLFIALTVGETTYHGWYDFVLWPSLTISTVLLLREIYETRNGLLFGLFWLMLLPALRLALVFAGEYAALSPWLIRSLIALGFTPLVWQLAGQHKLVRVTMISLLVLLIGANVTAVLTVTHEAYWLQAAFFELPQ